jgi:hypothetical protein
VGWTSGEGTVHRELGGDVPLRLVRDCVAQLKAEHRAATIRAEQERRTSMSVHARNAIWSVDGTHLGRDAHGAPVIGEIVRDVASTETLGSSIGPPPSSKDLAEVVERVVIVTGEKPLVIARDGGPENRGALEAWCEANDVVLLTNLPRTPQHNPWVEHGNREIKDETGLGKGHRVQSTWTVACRVMAALDRIDGERPRPTRDWKTAREAYAALPDAEALVGRDGFVHAVHCARTQAVQDCRTPRQERLAEREAVLATLDCFGLITRHRGRAPTRDANAEDVL